MRLMFFLFAFVGLCLAGGGVPTGTAPTTFSHSNNTCIPLTLGQDSDGTSPNPLTLYFGAKDGHFNTSLWEFDYDGYAIKFECCWWGDSNSDFYVDTSSTYIPELGTSFSDYSLYNSGNFWINQIPLLGGKNYSNTGESDFVHLANFTCGNDGHSALHGPLYPDYRERNFGERGQIHALESYLHTSAPNETSYVRYILFTTNVGSETERAAFWSDWYTHDYLTNIAPVSTGSRYFAAFPFLEGDTGQTGTRPEVPYILNSVHARGPKGRDHTPVVYADMDDYIVSYVYNTQIPAGKTIAFMVVVGYAMNKEMLLSTAAEIDVEPAQLFHGLNADQLSLIVNWGACEAVLGPAVSVRVDPPQSCSSGLTSTFTAIVNTTRSDLTAGWTHRVTIQGGFEASPASSLSSFEVPNDVGTAVHQLWYKDCLVKSTTFNACTKTTSNIPTTTAPTATSSASTTIASLILLGTAFALV